MIQFDLSDCIAFRAISRQPFFSLMKLSQPYRHKRASTVILMLFAIPSAILGAQLSTTVTIISSSPTCTYGSPVVLSAVVTPAVATGKVTFYDGTIVLGKAVLSIGQTKLATSLLSSGKRSLTAYYSGDAVYAPSTSATLVQTVNLQPGGGFQYPRSDAAGFEPWSLTVGDFNGDGKPDLAIVFIGADAIGIFLGNGDGTFQNPVTYNGVDNARWIVAADFNGDGYTDLVAANYGGNSVSVFLGNGDGTFAPATTYSVGVSGTGSYAIAAGDWNADGNVDLAVANSGANTVSFLMGNGDGTFRLAGSVGVGSGPRSIAVGDFNEDGRPDLVTGDYSGSTVTVLLNQGGGDFSVAASYTTVLNGNPSTTTNPRSITTGDFNGDGHTDLAVVNQTTNDVGIFLGDGDGTFQAAQSACSTCVVNAPYSVAAADFNADGILDLVTANYGGNNVSLLTGNGDGTFTVSGPFGADKNPAWVTVGAFTGNGMADVITVNYGANTVSILAGVTPSPDLSISLTPPSIGQLAPGQSGAYTITVANVGFANTSGTVTVTDSLPAGLSATNLAGNGWSCSISEVTCTRQDALTPHNSYPPIALTLNVSATTPGGVTNTASVSGGGETNSANDAASDYTTTFSPTLVSQVWSSPAALPQSFATSTTSADAPILMSDGTVMVHQFCSGNWYQLTPDLSGNYVTGNWSAAPSMPQGYAPLYFSSAVLPDGRLVVIGGEYNGSGCSSHVETTLGAVYDPMAKTWTALGAPSGWTGVGDATNVVLPSGQMVLAENTGTSIAELNPYTLVWTNLKSGYKADNNAEEGWTLLPDGSVLTVDITNAGESERYFPSTDTWAYAGDTVVPLVTGREIGPQILRPDGTVFVPGATGHTAVYDFANESWSAGPDFPVGRSGLLGVADGPGVLLPSGNVLVAASSYSPGPLDAYEQLSFFFEFDGTHLNPVPAPTGPTTGSYFTHLLLLPSGQVLFTDRTTVSIYTPAGTPDPSWSPSIVSAPDAIHAGQTYTITGTQLNGLSQAAMYGDDYQAATNFPLVRIVNTATGHVFYCRTHSHSTMAVATGSAIVFTKFDVPSTIETGSSTLVVVANGIASAPWNLTITPAAPVPPTISSIVGGALSVPPVLEISANGYFTIFGSGFENGGSTQESATSLVNGSLPTILNSVCVDIGLSRAFLSFVSSTQMNAVAPSLPSSGSVPVTVIANCGTANEVTSVPFNVQVSTATPEFLYWVQNSTGQNPVIAMDGLKGNLIGPPGLISGLTFRAATPGEVVTIYGISFGATASGPIPGTPPTMADSVSAGYSVSIGGEAASGSYAGVTPDSAGLYHLTL